MAMASDGETADAAATDRRQEITFEPIERGERLSDRVAGLMLQRILDTGMQAGDRLPSERELGIQFGVSRTVVREAMRSLAARGVVAVRPGAGLTVAQVDPATASESFGLLLRGSPSLRHDKIHEVRRGIEVQVAGLAAERATDEDVASLRRALDRHRAVLEDLEQAAPADVAFHVALARCTHNDLFVVMLDSLGDVMLEFRRKAMERRGNRGVGFAEHTRVFDAVAAHDPAAARAAMTTHLESSDRAFRGLENPPVAT
jgi:GntR family transcriptional repressor for pyruvate dehydrogenase complex